jgi:hypothetical protein
MRDTLWMGALLLLVGCGDHQMGGGGIEIPNGLTMTVTAPGARPVAGVRVRLVARDSWVPRVVSGQTVVLDSAVSDSFGRVSFRDVPVRDGYWLDAVSGSVGAHLQGDASGERSMELQPLSRLEGVVDSGTGAGMAVRLSGSDRIAYTDAQGLFVFDSLPQGSWSIVGGKDRTRLGTLSTLDLGVSPILLHSVSTETDTLLLDDFSDGNSMWSLQNLFGSGYWWLDAQDHQVRAVFGVDGAWQSVTGDSKSRWIRANVDSAAMVGRSWANLGLNFGPPHGVLPELSRLKGIHVRCRGTGYWTVALAEQIGDSAPAWTARLPLSSAWTDLRIPTTALWTPGGGAWSDAPRHVRELVFQTGAAGTIEISRVTLEGASLVDWAR